MLLINWLLGFLVLSLLLAWRPAKPGTALLVFAVALVFFSVQGPAAALLKVLLWGLLALAAAALWLSDLRREYVTRPLMVWAKQKLPTLSPTEREAIEAGSVGWEGQLFGGRPDWHLLRAIPTPELSPAEQAFLEGPVEEFCALLDDWEISHQRADLPPAAWKLLKSRGFFGLEIPEDFGGLGFSAGAHAAILRRIASTPAGMVASSIVAVPNSLGPAALLLRYGTAEQKQHFLPRLASGEEVPCFALTSPVAGSDAGAITDAGVVCTGEWQGREVTGIRLNFDKRYITLAPVATLIGLAFRLRDPDQLLGEHAELGLCCALLDAKLPGIDSGRRHLPLNAPFMNGPVRGKDVFVPLEALIGGTAMIGQGWRMLIESLAAGRGISLPAGSSGILQGVARNTGAYARLREQFGQPVGNFEGVAETLGRLGARAYAVRALSRFAAGAVDQGERPAVANAIAKLQATELMRQGVGEAMDIHAGKGVMLGPNNWLGRLWQSAPVHITVEGANILTRSMMIYGQGAMRAHPFLLAELEALGKDDLTGFESQLGRHLGHVASVVSRSLVHALSGSLLARAPRSDAARHYQHLARYSAAFALTSDICLLSLGADLKRREALSGRLADALSWLYIASVSLKQYDEGPSGAADRPALDWVCAQAWTEIEQALDGVLRHLPARGLAVLARVLIFPLGRRARPASDDTLFAIAKALQTPGEARDALTVDAWVSQDDQKPTGRLEFCLNELGRMQSQQQRLDRAIADQQLNPGPELADAAATAGILTQTEAQELKSWQAQLAAVLAVDDFSTQELAHSKQRRTTTKTGS